MDSDYQQRLEREIDGKLKSLRELRAPQTLISRVMREIERRSALPWFRRAWQTWPVGLQAASLLLLLSAFGGLCLGGWEVSNTGPAMASERFGGWLSGFSALARVGQVLAGAGSAILHNLGPGFLIGCAAAIALSYALCLGLGAVCVRLAFAHKEQV